MLFMMDTLSCHSFSVTHMPLASNTTTTTSPQHSTTLFLTTVFSPDGTSAECWRAKCKWVRNSQASKRTMVPLTITSTPNTCHSSTTIISTEDKFPSARSECSNQRLELLLTTITTTERHFRSIPSPLSLADHSAGLHLFKRLLY